MKNESEYEQAQELFERLRDKTPEEQSQSLEEIRQSNAHLAEDVAALLEANAIDDDFLKPPSGRMPLLPKTETITSKPVARKDYPKQIGPYRILQLIGEGGHGMVFMAEQRTPIRRQVALKWIKPGMESELILARFEAERQALAMMTHPSIANVIDAGATEEGHPYFVMELVHGVPVDQFCQENNADLTLRLEIMKQVCEAVHHAHQKGIIHRDIKPANVLVTTDSGRPLAKVIDFGIAKALHVPLTEKTMFTEYGQIVGTLEYMSPEQAMMSQNVADVRSDVYSLGVLLYVLLTGATPISKKELLSKGIWELRNVLHAYRPATPSLRATHERGARRWVEHEQAPVWISRLKGDLDWITMKALAKEPAQRYDSPAALADDLSRFINGEQVLARPPSLGYVLSKLIKRNRVAVSIASALALSFCLSFAAVIWGYVKSTQNLGLATAARQLVAEKASQLEVALRATEGEKQRADASANRLGKMLKRSILESAWRTALDGDAMQAKVSLQDIGVNNRDFSWHFVDSVRRQMDWPSLRGESEQAIRAQAMQQQLGLLAIITTDSKLELWDVTQRKRLQDVALPPSIYSCLAFSDDGQHILVGGSGASVTSIEVRTGNVEARVTHGSGGTRQLAHDVQGNRWLVTTGANYLLALDFETLATEHQTKLPSRISSLGLSKDARFVLVSGIDGNCFAFPSSDLSRFVTLEDVGSAASGFAWLPEKLLIANERAVMFELDMNTLEDAFHDEGSTFGRLLVQPMRTADTNRALSIGIPSAVALTETGDIIIGDRDGSVFAIPLGQRQRIPIRKFSSAIRHIETRKGSAELVVSQLSGRINVISSEDVECRCRYATQLADLSDGIALGAEFVSVTVHNDGSVKRWDTQTGELLEEERVHRAEVFSVDVCESKNLLATMASDWEIAVLQGDTLEENIRLPVALGVRPVAFSSTGGLLAGAPNRNNLEALTEGTVDLWNPATGRAVQRLVGHTNWVMAIHFFDSDSQLATLSLDGTVKIWSVERGECVQTLDLSNLSTATAFQILPEQGRAATGHEDGTISLWDLNSGKLLRTQQVAGNRISGLLSPTGSDTLLFTSDNSPDLTCLDSRSLEVQAQLDVGTGNIIGLRTDSTSQRIQILGDSGAIRIWQLPKFPMVTKSNSR